MTAMRRVTQQSMERSCFVSSINDFVGDVRPKKLPNPKKALERARAELDEIMSTREWSKATGRHFVALYALFHGHVYGVPPLELESEAFHGATSAAARMLRDEFAGEPLRFMEFVRWTWRREREREKRRRAEGQDGRRIGWKLQFVLRHLLTDYRCAAVAAASSNGRR